MALRIYSAVAGEDEAFIEGIEYNHQPHHSSSIKNFIDNIATIVANT